MPGDFIYFYDIHGNCICDGRYAQGKELTLISAGNPELLTVSDFDFSKAKDSLAYQELRNDFKHQLFARQKGLMKEYKKYEAFIEPYLVEAERCLKALQYCKQNARATKAKVYTANLLNYNVACFHHYAMPNKVTHGFLQLAQAELMNVITQIQSEGQLENFDAQQELKNTAQLFRRANKSFYKKLPYRFRVAAFFGKYI